MRWSVVVPLAWLVLTGTGCTSGDVPVVGVRYLGFDVERLVDSADYSSRLTTILEDLQVQAVPVLEAREVALTENEWTLRRVMIGAGAEGSVGIGEYVRLGGTIGFRMILSNIAE